MDEAMAPLREELELEQTKADITHKRVQAQGEPWKAMPTAFGAGATIAAALSALAPYMRARTH